MPLHILFLMYWLNWIICIFPVTQLRDDYIAAEGTVNVRAGDLQQYRCGRSRDIRQRYMLPLCFWYACFLSLLYPMSMKYTDFGVLIMASMSSTATYYKLSRCCGSSPALTESYFFSRVTGYNGRRVFDYSFSHKNESPYFEFCSSSVRRIICSALFDILGINWFTPS